MDSLGSIIRKSREDKKLPLRIVSSFLDIDQAILSKIERGQRNATREQVIKLAKYFKVPENDLLVAWLSDKLLYEVQDEKVALKALQVAEEKIAYKPIPKNEKQEIIKKIISFFKTDGRVSKAWIFGSFIRGDDHQNSDIDLMVTYSDKASGTLLDYADIKFQLEHLLQRKVDLVENNYIKPFAVENINKDKKLIYG